MEESVDNDGESILRTLTRARVSDARANELSVAAVSTGAGSAPAGPHMRSDSLLATRAASPDIAGDAASEFT